MSISKNILAIIAVLGILLSGCMTTPTPTPSVTPTSTPTVSVSPTPAISIYDAEYILLGKYFDYFWCDPDFYPVARPGIEEKNAADQFAGIKANLSEFTAIIGHLKLADKADYTDQEKLEIYRQHKTLLRALQIAAVPEGGYKFTVRVGQNQGQQIDGFVNARGQITESGRTTSFNTCPICLTAGTLIETPEGPIPVEQVRAGTIVWTMDEQGKIVAAPVLKISNTPVPAGFQVVKVSLSDGRSVAASPGHPTAELRPLGDYRVGDSLDGAVITGFILETYDGSATYDLLPAGETGLYKANGIWLKSTLW